MRTDDAVDRPYARLDLLDQLQCPFDLRELVAEQPAVQLNRAERIAEMIDAETAVSSADIARMQQDVVSLQPRALAGSGRAAAERSAGKRKVANPAAA